MRVFQSVIAIVILSLIAASSAQAQTPVVVIPLLGGEDEGARVQKTGQTTCYSDLGAIISCSSTGQDGELQKGVEWPDPRFEDNTDGTVTDNLTDLIWLKNANCIESLDPGFDGEDVSGDGRVTRAKAFAFINGLNQSTGKTDCDDTSNGGTRQTDWRLPNRFEQESLLDIGQAGPALPSGHPFINVETDTYYWTSSYNSFFADLGIGWAILFSSGDVESKDWNGDYLYVWPVRGGD